MKINKTISLFVSAALFTLPSLSFGHSSGPAENATANSSETASSLFDSKVLPSLKQQVLQSYGAESVKFLGPVEWVRRTPGWTASTDTEFHILGDNGKGELRFAVSGAKGEYAEGTLLFSAWVFGKIAIRRVHPGEILRSESFVTQKIDVSTGLGREYRGLILPKDLDVSRLEATQTILEGKFLISSAVRNVPDIRRGDSVRIQLSNEVIALSTLGVAQEQGYVNHQVRVLTGKTKKELLGQLQPGGIVEVKL